ncbi:MAG: hypothetical protein QOJ78_2049, partial [Pseudonocardiales bacterium]|nr:hypothetical protein [Pseudonocardiales bacterium]
MRCAGSAAVNVRTSTESGYDMTRADYSDKIPNNVDLH